MASNAHAVAVPAVSGKLQASNPSWTLYGYSLAETAATTATILLRAGTASGVIICNIPLSASQGAENWFGPQGIYVVDEVNGIYVTVTGTVSGSIWVG